MTVGATVFGEAFKMGSSEVPAVKADFEFGVMFARLTTELLAEGKLKPHPPDVRPGGLDGILDGLKDMKENKVSGLKLVYQIK